MGTELIQGVYFFPINQIITTGGVVMHAIKGLDASFSQFGECYFSTTNRNSPKAWKKHTKMVCNLFVLVGKVKFVFYDDRPDSKDFNKVVEFDLSRDNYGRLVIEPGIWFGFAGIGTSDESIIVNLANINHDPSESFRIENELATIPYTWKF